MQHKFWRYLKQKFSQNILKLVALRMNPENVTKYTTKYSLAKILVSLRFMMRLASAYFWISILQIFELRWIICAYVVTKCLNFRDFICKHTFNCVGEVKFTYNLYLFTDDMREVHVWRFSRTFVWFQVNNS